MNKVDNRRAPYHPSVECSWSLGIARIYFEAIEAYVKHDNNCEAKGDTRYQQGYRLYKHVMETSNGMYEVSHARNRSKWDTDVGCGAALLHDIGKTHPSVIVYRFDRKVTSEEKDVIDQHPEYSDQLVLKSLPHVRAVDRRFLLQVRLPVRYHHKPWLIRPMELRAIGYDLKFVDALVSRVEDRGSRLGLPRQVAVEDFLPMWLEDQLKKFPEMGTGENAHLAYDSLKVIQDLYS